MSARDAPDLAQTPAQQRLLTGLLGWGEPRPQVPPTFAALLRADLEQQLAGMAPELARAAEAARGGRIVITKTRLDRLVCDGYALDAVRFAWSRASARGALVHAAIERDWDTGRQLAPDAVVERVWQETACAHPGDPRSLSAWLNACPAAEAQELRAEAADLVAGFREVWPALPPAQINVRLERRVEVSLAGGRVLLQGVPDMLLTSPRDDGRARDLVVDLKTGLPRAEHDRHELRFYALLATLDRGRPPFRWATFYVTEGRPEVEDFRPETLEVTARRVVDGVRQQLRLLEPAERHRLRGGAWCRFCTRPPDCAAAAP